jgi:hypothetical protein
MRPRDACGEVVDVVVEEGGAGGGTEQLREFVDRSASSRPPGPAQVKITMGSPTSWDRPVDRSYFVRVRQGDRAVTGAWGTGAYLGREPRRAVRRAARLGGPAARSGKKVSFRARAGEQKRASSPELFVKTVAEHPRRCLQEKRQGRPGPTEPSVADRASCRCSALPTPAGRATRLGPGRSSPACRPCRPAGVGGERARR